MSLDSIADRTIGAGVIGLSRLYTSAGVDPYDEVVWERRDARITNWVDGSVAFEQLGVEFPIAWSQNATNIVTQKYFRGALGSPGREWSLKQVVDRIVDTITDWGVGRRLLRRRRSRRVPRRTEVHPRDAAGGIQQPGVVQHRCTGRAAAGERLFHPRGRRRDALDPQLVPRGGDHLQGRLGCRCQPVTDPVVVRAVGGWRHRLGSRELHARGRRVGGHDQVGRQDPAGRQDGDPRRRSSRHRAVRVGQGVGGT